MLLLLCCVWALEYIIFSTIQSSPGISSATILEEDTHIHPSDPVMIHMHTLEKPFIHPSVHLSLHPEYNTAGLP